MQIQRYEKNLYRPKELKKILKNTLNILLPIVLGGGILYWMYRGFDFTRIEQSLLHETNWWWMAFSLVFGITAQVFRGLRWRQTLDPLGEHPQRMNCVHAIFISYTTSLIIPRSGEVARCGVLTKYDGTSFSKSLGTVVTERAVDSILLLIISLLAFVFQLKEFMHFFDETGTNFSEWFSAFTATGYIVTAVLAVITIAFICFAIRHFTVFARLQKIISDIKAGIFSLRNVQNKWLYLAYTLGIWGSYFLHFYITFFCFSYTSQLGPMVALLAFVVGSFAVIVPTPNGMGSWHFAVKTVLLLAGVECAADAETYVLIVHTVQTALLPVLGIFSAICLAMKTPMKSTVSDESAEQPSVAEDD